MTNTRITNPESLEKRYPVVLREFSIREGSGGKGVHDGGDGVVRDIECRAPLKFGVITSGGSLLLKALTKSRPTFLRYSRADRLFSGGGEGEMGANYWVKRDSDGTERWVSMGPKNMV